jgi:lysophospholipase L1-like esterase
VLRLAGVARPPSYFVQHRIGPQTYLTIDPEIARRFFPPALGRIIPKPSFQILNAAKPAGVRRVLCLGESTTAGFPFPVMGSFPGILQRLLEERDPKGGWEVINCGMTAISSSTVAALIDELLSTDPDALVVYLGHNEFYGAGGTGSIGAGVVQSLRGLRIVRALESLLSKPKTGSEPGTLMTRMVRRASIAPDSPLRRRAFERYRENLDRILSAAVKRGVRVVLCEVVSNEADLYPFGSAIGTADAPPVPARFASWGGRIELDDALLGLGELDTRVVGDSTRAEWRYLRGLARRALARPDAAAEFRAARDLDAVPFRAPDAVNAVIRDAARRYGSTLVPTEGIFRRAAPGGVPGFESFVEHLHPTFLGNARIAGAAADALLGRPFEEVTEADAGRWFRMSGLTRFDLASADARIRQLYARWPYTREGAAAPPFRYRARSVREEVAGLLRACGDTLGEAYILGRDPEEEELVEAMLQRRIHVLEAHTRLARSAMARNALPDATRELVAAVRLYPIDWSLWTDLAEVRAKLGDRDGCVWAARNALSWNPSAPRARELLNQATQPAAGPERP